MLDKRVDQQPRLTFLWPSTQQLKGLFSSAQLGCLVTDQEFLVDKTRCLLPRTSHVHFKNRKGKKSAGRGLLIIQFGAAKWNENTRYSKERKRGIFPLYQRWSWDLRKSQLGSIRAAKVLCKAHL